MINLHNKTALVRNFYDNTSIDYVFNKTIVYYDMEKANISILKDANKITDEEYSILCNTNKLDRQKIVGKMIRDNPELNTLLDSQLERYRNELFYKAFDDENDIVLHVVRDGIFVIVNNDGMHKRLFEPYIFLSDHVRFRLEGMFPIFMRLNSILWYYNNNGYIIRGMNEDVKSYHHTGFSSILSIISRKIINGDLIDASNFV